MLTEYAGILFKARFIATGFIIAITVMLAASIDIESDNSIRAWFSKDDPHYIAYEHFIDTFGGGKYLIVALKSDQIFTLDILNFIKSKTDILASFEFIARVYSLANAKRITGTSEYIKVEPLLSDLKAENLNQIRTHTLGDPHLLNYLISPDERFSAIIIAFEDFSSEMAEVEAVDLLEKTVFQDKPDNVEIFISGDSKLMAAFNTYTKQTQKQGACLVVSIICICIFVLFRSPYKTIMILINMGASLCWSLGFFTILGFRFNAVTALIVPLILVLSIADSVHIIHYFEEISSRCSDRKASFIRTVAYMVSPCFITSITTAFGLLSLTVSRIDAVKQFGISSAAGVMFAFLISMILVPFLLTLFPSIQKEKKDGGGKLNFSKIITINHYRYPYILIATFLGLMAAFWGISKIRVESNRLEWFPKNGSFYRSAKIVEKHLFGIDNLEIVLKGKDQIFMRPDILRKIDSLSAEIERLPHVKKVLSLTNYIKKINLALHEDNPDFYRVPDNQALIAQELLLFTLFDGCTQEINSFVTPDYSEGRISIKTETMSSEESIKFGNLLQKMTNETFSYSDLEVVLTGTIYLYNINLKRLVESQITSFSLAFLFIIGFLFLAFRSFEYGILSILPNLFPVVFVMGTLGWCGSALNTTTVMVASVALGIAVDDSVHFISRFRKEISARNLPIHSVLKATTNSVGRAIVFTSMINIAGFLTLSIIDFQPTREFGLLISAAMLFALIGDLIVLPASIVAVKGWLYRSTYRAGMNRK